MQVVRHSDGDSQAVVHATRTVTARERPHYPGRVHQGVRVKAAALEDNDWHEDAVATIWAISVTRPEFTSDDLRREMRPAPHPNHYGAAFTAAKAHGYIEPVGYQTSTAPSRHRGVLRTWRLKERITP